MTKEKISEIKISEDFASHQPSEQKVANKVKWIRKRERQHRTFCKVVLDENGVLVDGYATLIAMEQLGYTECYCNVKKPSYRETPTTYIFGYHPNDKKKREFVWRIPRYMEESTFGTILPNDCVLCNTKFGIAPVIVTRIETLDECPVDMRVKKFVRKFDNKR